MLFFNRPTPAFTVLALIAMVAAPFHAAADTQPTAHSPVIAARQTVSFNTSYSRNTGPADSLPDLNEHAPRLDLTPAGASIFITQIPEPAGYNDLLGTPESQRFEAMMSFDAARPLFLNAPPNTRTLFSPHLPEAGDTAAPLQDMPGGVGREPIVTLPSPGDHYDRPSAPASAASNIFKNAVQLIGFIVLILAVPVLYRALRRFVSTD